MKSLFWLIWHWLCIVLIIICWITLFTRLLSLSHVCNWRHALSFHEWVLDIFNNGGDTTKYRSRRIPYYKAKIQQSTGAAEYRQIRGGDTTKYRSRRIQQYEAEIQQSTGAAVHNNTNLWYFANVTLWGYNHIRYEAEIHQEYQQPTQLNYCYTETEIYTKSTNSRHSYTTVTPTAVTSEARRKISRNETIVLRMPHASNVASVVHSNALNQLVYRNSELNVIIISCSDVEIRWNTYSNSNVQFLTVQRSFTRRLLSLRFYSYPDRLKILNIDSLELRRLKTVLSVLCIINFSMDWLIWMPKYFSKLINQNVHSTRTNGMKLTKPVSKTSLHSNTISHRCINCWNSLPPDLVLASSLSSFNHKLNEFDFSRFLTLC